MDESKKEFMDADGNHEQIDLGMLTSESYQQMSLSERVSVCEAIAHRSSVVRNFSQSFLDAVRDQRQRQDEPKNRADRQNQSGLNQPKNI